MFCRIFFCWSCPLTALNGSMECHIAFKIVQQLVEPMYGFSFFPFFLPESMQWDPLKIHDEGLFPPFFCE